MSINITRMELEAINNTLMQLEDLRMTQTQRDSFNLATNTIAAVYRRADNALKAQMMPTTPTSTSTFIPPYNIDLVDKRVFPHEREDGPDCQYCTPQGCSYCGEGTTPPTSTNSDGLIPDRDYMDEDQAADNSLDDREAFELEMALSRDLEDRTLPEV